MTKHLNVEEQIDALEGALHATRRAHLDACAECRQDLAGLRQVWDGLTVTTGDDVPEQSAIFWGQFQQRVAAAVDPAAGRGSAAWWRGSPQAWWTLATAAAVLVTAVLVSPGRFDWGGMVREAEVAEAAPAGSFAGDQVQWQFVTDVLIGLEQDAVHEILGPSPVAVDTALESLSADERAALARLLEAEMAEGSE